MRKHFLSFSDMTSGELYDLFELSKKLKKDKISPILNGKVLALIFEKPSLRTRFTFEAGMFELGGYAIYLAPQDIGLGKRESIPDAARNLSRWASGIMARTFEHKTVLQLAKYATIPVINGLSDIEHPCQVLADMFTIWEKRGTFSNIKLAWVGDGNNVCNSLIIASKILKFDLSISTPSGYEPNKKFTNTSSIYVTNEPLDAVKEADIIYTDVWTSMGQEMEREERLKKFKEFQVNNNLLKKAKSDCLIMHCLPAHRGEEITDDVIDGPQSIVFDQAENRLHAQKALLVKLLSE
ncbi:ornithine carbamoyltransferase [candidate division WOR-3 bacterium]|nr:ornithine carbamoyltransferase [candidate division WOR-3 bacterium]